VGERGEGSCAVGREYTICFQCSTFNINFSNLFLFPLGANTFVCVCVCDLCVCCVCVCHIHFASFLAFLQEITACNLHSVVK